MAAVIGALRAELSATIAKFQEDMKKAGASVREFATKAEATGKRLQRVGAQMTVALTAPLVAFGVKAVQAATESAQALGQLDAALKSTEHQAGRTLKQLQAQAKALESISTFDDDDILKDVTTNLTKFGNVVGEVFDKAQLAIVNMASRTGDLASATQTVGRALNDPINGINALTRAGVQFTNQEKEKIKALVASGRGIEAQAIILAKLETAYAGAAQALRDATPTAALNQQWRELTEIVGGILVDILPPIIDLLKGIAAAFNSLSPEMQRLTVYTALFVAALGPLVTIIGTLMRVAALLTPIIVGLGAALAGISAPVWAIVAAVTAAVGALLIFWRAVGKLLQGDFTAAWEEAKKAAREMWNDLTSMFSDKPVKVPVELVGPDGKPIAPGKTNFSLPKPDTDTERGTFPSEITVTPMQEISPDFWRGMSTEMMNVISFFADRFVGEIQARRDKVMTQEETVDLHMRRGEHGFLSDDMMRRLQIARDLEHQQLDAEERLQRLRSDLQQAEIEHDGAKIENISNQIILEEQLLALIKQTSVEQIRREERLQQAVSDFVDRFESDLMNMLENWSFSLKGLGDAFKKLLFDILVKPHVEAAGQALGDLIKSGIKFGAGQLGLPGFAEGGLIPPSQWAVVGERGPELVFGGKTGLSVMSNEDATRSGGFGSNTTIIQNIRTQDVNSFQRTRRQLARDTKRALQEA